MIWSSNCMMFLKFLDFNEFIIFLGFPLCYIFVCN